MPTFPTAFRRKWSAPLPRIARLCDSTRTDLRNRERFGPVHRGVLSQALWPIADDGAHNRTVGPAGRNKAGSPTRNQVGETAGEECCQRATATKRVAAGWRG